MVHPVSYSYHVPIDVRHNIFGPTRRKCWLPTVLPWLQLLQISQSGASASAMASPTPTLDFEVQARAQIQPWSQRGHLQRVQYNVPLPTIVNSPTEAVACRETTLETTAVSHHVSDGIRAFYRQLPLEHAWLGAPRDDNTGFTIIIDTQAFQGDTLCNHRRFHSR